MVVRVLKSDMLQHPDDALKLVQMEIFVAKDGKELPQSKVDSGYNLYTIDEKAFKDWCQKTMTDEASAMFRKFLPDDQNPIDYLWHNVETMRAEAEPTPNAHSREDMPQTDKVDGEFISPRAEEVSENTKVSKNTKISESNKRRKTTMKKLNITKERYEKSRYFNKKYGKLEYVSESGNVFKTSKGKVLTFVKESYDNVMSIEKWIRSKIKSGELPEVEKFKGGSMPLIRFKGSNIRFKYVLQQIGLDSGDKSLWSDEAETSYPPKKLIEKIEDWFISTPERQRIDVLMDALNKVYDKGGIFGKAVDKKLWLDIPNAFDDGEYIIYGKVEIPKIDVISNLAEDYPELDELDENEQEDWLQSHKKDVAKMIKEMAWTYRESTAKFGRR